MRLLAPTAAMALLILPSAGVAQTAQPQAIVDFFRTVGGITLTPQEQRSILVEQKALGVRDASKWRKEWADAVRSIAAFRSASAEDQAAARHQWRASFHFTGQETPVAFAIVTRLDSVLIEDRARKDVVTRADYAALLASNSFMAGLAKTSPPASNETPSAIAELRESYQRHGNMRAVLTQAQVRYHLSQRVWNAMSPADREKLRAVVRANVKAPSMVADAARAFETECVTAYVAASQRRGSAIHPSISAYGIAANNAAFMRGMVHMRF